MALHRKSIELINKAVADELATVHQYMYFHFHCDDQGLDLLANLFRRTAIEEMLHIERLAERILFLKGEVELVPERPVSKILKVQDMLDAARKMEEGTVIAYNQWANECAANADLMSKKLFEDLIMDEERHYDQFDKEHENLVEYGENYLALQLMERSKRTGMNAAPPQTGQA